MKKHLYIHIITLALVLLAAQTAYAEEGSVRVSAQINASTTVKAPIREVRKEIREDRAEMNKGIRDDRKALASTTASSTPAERREDRKEFREETKEKRENFREDAKKKLELIRQQTMARIVINRLNATITRLEKIVAKLDTRIAKFKEKGADVTAPTKASADAKLALADARVKLNAIVIPTTLTGSTTASSTASTTTQSIKSAVKEIEDIIKKAHKAVVAALESFKGQSVKATTTPITTGTGSTTTTTN